MKQLKLLSIYMFIKKRRKLGTLIIAIDLVRSRKLRYILPAIVQHFLNNA